MNIKQIAENLVQKHETRDPFKIAEEEGIIVHLYPLVDVRAFCHYYRGTPVICINSELPEELYAYECAHELGHVFLHRGSNALFFEDKTCFCMSKYENEADQFAMDLLIGDDALEECADLRVEQISRMLGYEERMIRLRLRDFKLFSGD